MNSDRTHQVLSHYLHVQDGGKTEVLSVSDTFWQDLASGAYPHLDQGRLLTAFTFSEPWPSWERHPAGEELVMLLSGSAVVLLEQHGTVQEVSLTVPDAYVLVPTGTWHTARTSEPTTMIFLTPGAGTEHKSV
jgi:hypothetical protein